MVSYMFYGLCMLLLRHAVDDQVQISLSKYKKLVSLDFNFELVVKLSIFH